ncbi:MAG TPA: amphi-Trp domain-containing protein [Polyangiaceae bacterium]|nr:amphi-Trp domain-containing protein [Polyangiaceae bacterium]
MKRRKIRYTDERSVSACIEQLQALLEGLKAGKIELSDHEGPLQLAPAGPVTFDLRVDQQRRKEVLKVELSWLLDAAVASEPVSELAEDATRGPLSVPPPHNGSSNGNGHDEAGLSGLAAGEYRELFAAARTRGSDGRWHIDQDRLVQSLALAGVDALTQQELYALALQADADGSAAAFNDRVIEALEQASQHPPPPTPEHAEPTTAE